MPPLVTGVGLSSWGQGPTHLPSPPPTYSSRLAHLTPGGPWTNQFLPQTTAAHTLAPPAGEDVPLQTPEGDSLGRRRGSCTHAPCVPCGWRGRPALSQKVAERGPSQERSTASLGALFHFLEAKNTLALPRQPLRAQGSRQWER